MAIDIHLCLYMYMKCIHFSSDVTVLVNMVYMKGERVL